MRHFHHLLQSRWSQGRFISLGLDSDLSKLPPSALRYREGGEVDVANSLIFFNKAIIEATHDLLCAYKPNTAFYEAYGVAGMVALEKTMELIDQIAPEVPVILDAKRADIGSTNEGTVAFAFDYLKADAITLNPYLGREALAPFLERREKGIFILSKTSNIGSDEFQSLCLNGEPLYQIVARRVAQEWNTHGNCGLVVGATYPRELAHVRKIAPSLPLLIPGIGTQGGSLEETIAAALNSRREGVIINSSRALLFASSGEDFAAAARAQTQKLQHLLEAELS